MSARWVRYALGRLVDDRTMERVLEPLLADVAAEHADAIAHGRRLRARWVVARAGWDLARTLIALWMSASGERAKATRWRLPLAGLAVALLGIASIGELGGRQALQACWLAAGAVLAAMLLVVPSRWLAAHRIWFAACAVPLAWTLIAGETYDGATRWLALGPLRVMPSELCRPLLLLAIAGTLVRRAEAGQLGGPRRGSRGRPLVEAAVMTSLAALAIAGQPDPGAALVLLAAVAVMYVDTAGMGAAVAGLAPALLVALVMSVARGGSLASAWAAGTSTAGNAAGDTDLWLAGVEARFGLVGALISLSLVVLLVQELWSAARLAGRWRPLARGAAVALLVQAVLHSLGAIGLLPTSTIGLPLLSYGGSGVVGWMLCLMIVARVSCTPGEEKIAAGA